MSDPTIQYNYEKDAVSSDTASEDEARSMVSFVRRYSGGLIKDNHQAAYLLLAFAALMALLSFFILLRAGGVASVPSSQSTPPSGF